MVHVLILKHQSFLRNCRSTKKKFFGHVLGCGAGVLGESGSVNQCGTNGKVYERKLNLNHPTKASFTFLVIIMGYPAPQNPWRFETVSNASQTPECMYQSV